ncbi:MAG: hypothetical protein N7Q72_06615, partial [Spiroplasma sp. Tabriz.8]|nr:hypothetical protein [Spiroplasma sp. Tabriz.8]
KKPKPSLFLCCIVFFYLESLISLSRIKVFSLSLSLSLSLSFWSLVVSFFLGFAYLCLYFWHIHSSSRPKQEN